MSLMSSASNTSFSSSSSFWRKKIRIGERKKEKKKKNLSGNRKPTYQPNFDFGLRKIFLLVNLGMYRSYLSDFLFSCYNNVKSKRFFVSVH